MLKRLFGGFHRSSAKSQLPITIVSGLPRSGTSLMMRMLEAGGILPLTDHERVADEDNPGGYYEFERVKQLEKGDTAWLEKMSGKAVKVISMLLRSLPADYHYKVVFMERELAEVLASQRKMLEHRDEEVDDLLDAKMFEIFTKHLAETKAWLAQQSNFDVLYINYGDLLIDPTPQVAQLATFFDDALDTTAMAQVIDPALYRNRGETNGDTI